MLPDRAWDRCCSDSSLCSSRRACDQSIDPPQGPGENGNVERQGGDGRHFVRGLEEAPSAKSGRRARL